MAPSLSDEEVCYLITLREMLIVRLHFLATCRLIQEIDKALKRAKRKR